MKGLVRLYSITTYYSAFFSGSAGVAGVAGGGGGGGGDVVSAAAAGWSPGASVGAAIFLQPMLNAAHNPIAATNAIKRFMLIPSP